MLTWGEGGPQFTFPGPPASPEGCSAGARGGGGGSAPQPQWCWISPLALRHQDGNGGGAAGCTPLHSHRVGVGALAPMSGTLP